MKIPRLKLYFKKLLKFYREELHVTSALSDTIYLYFILNYSYHMLDKSDYVKRTELPTVIFYVQHTNSVSNAESLQRECIIKLLPLL